MVSFHAFQGFLLVLAASSNQDSTTTNADVFDGTTFEDEAVSPPTPAPEHSQDAEVCSCESQSTGTGDAWFPSMQVVTADAKGARCAVAADFDRDGDMDIVSASSTDNTVAWYERYSDGSFSVKQQVTFKSNGARIVTTGDVDGDGWIDIIAASYYDNVVGWFKNIPDDDGGRDFESDRRVISQTAMNAQGVTVADLDGDGDLDVASASSGDNTIAWYENLFNGTFCEVKTIVDDNAIGARTVVAADLDGDGDVDLASASKDDNTVAWYRNEDGKGTFSPKIVINSSAMGAYSLVPIDLDQDGDMDLVVASNADDKVSFFRNDGSAQFERIVIYDEADFVLSVFSADFDRDGCIDVASAEFFGNRIRWYRNLGPGCDGTQWENHTIYVGTQGHYVFGEDMDGDGDTDIIAVTHAENQVAVFYAATACDGSKEQPSAVCCVTGQFWNGTHCEMCPFGKYGTGNGVDAQCLDCPNACSISGLAVVPPTCHGITVCNDGIERRVAACDCGDMLYKDDHDVCVQCPDGQEKAPGDIRLPSDMQWVDSEDNSGNVFIAPWSNFNLDLCKAIEVVTVTDMVRPIILGSIVGVLALILLSYGLLRVRKYYKAIALAKKKYEDDVMTRIRRACKTTMILQFNICFIRFPNFENLGRLLAHEEVREQGMLVSKDTYQSVVDFVTKYPTMFISHQWLGYDEPDPQRIHYPAICEAGRRVCEKFQVEEELLHLWVDYVSIPQKNSHIKSLSISSLAVYASIARFFVIIAPKCVHRDKKLECNEETYQRRGWCRMEQWARMAVGGLQDIFIYDAVGKTLSPIEDKPSWYEASIHVFDGDFTVDADKYKLVDTVMGLWAQAKFQRRKELETHADPAHQGPQELMDLINRRKDTVFPKKYFLDMIPKLEQYILETEEDFYTNGMQETFDMVHSQRLSRMRGSIVHAGGDQGGAEPRSLPRTPQDSDDENVSPVVPPGYNFVN